MYVKNVSQMLKPNTLQNARPFEGSTITGKVLTNENGKGTVKLYDGTIIPAIFISENEIETEKQLKFVVQNFDGENFVLKLANDSDETKGQKSFFSIIRDMNIPFEEGKNIILDLLKFNLPATNENIDLIYKNMNFLNQLQKMSDTEIISFLKQAMNTEATEDSKEFHFTKELFQSLKTIDRSFLAFMLENDLPHSLENMTKAQEFMSNKFFLNSFIDNIKNIMSSVTLEDEGALQKYIKLLNESTEVVPKSNAENTTATVPKPLSITEQLMINSLSEKLLKTIPQLGDQMKSSLEQGYAQLKSSDSSVPELLNIDTMLQKLNDEFDINKYPQNFSKAIPTEAEKLILGSLSDKLSGNNGKLDKNMILATFEEVFNILSESNSVDSKNTSSISPTWMNHNFEKGVSNTPLSINEKLLMQEFTNALEHSIKGGNGQSEFHEALSIIRDNKDIFSFSTTKVYNELLKEFDPVKNPQNFVSTHVSKTEQLLVAALKNNILAEGGIISKETVVKSFEQALAVINDTIDISSLSSKDLFKKLLESTNQIKLPVTMMKGNPSETEKLLIDALIRNITKNAGSQEKHITVASFEEALNVFRENKDIFAFNGSGLYQKLMDSFDMFKQISPNYSLYFFNLYQGSSIFKNNIIIKNKLKGSKYIDINDVKAYITVDTKNLGTIEGNLYKKNNDISIYFNVSESHVSLFKTNLKALKNTLKEYGYNFVNLTVEAKDHSKILPFIDFFNESIFREVDIKV